VHFQHFPGWGAVKRLFNAQGCATPATAPLTCNWAATSTPANRGETPGRTQQISGMQQEERRTPVECRRKGNGRWRQHAPLHTHWALHHPRLLQRAAQTLVATVHGLRAKQAAETAWGKPRLHGCLAMPCQPEECLPTNQNPVRAVFSAWLPCRSSPLLGNRFPARCPLHLFQTRTRATRRLQRHPPPIANSSSRTKGLILAPYALCKQNYAFIS
jgi:hypothetical protein